LSAERRRRAAPSGATVVYGRNPVREALRGRRSVHRIFATRQARITDLLPPASQTPVEIVAREELERRCGSPDHQGVACEVEPFSYTDTDELLACEGALVVALDQLQDPQNVGAICRSAECAGAAGVVIPERRSAEVTAAVCSASAGAVEHLPVARVRNLADFLARARERGFWIYGAEASARTRYDAPDYSGSVVIVLGGEGSGLRPRVRAACDELVSLPLRGRLESLNVAATGAVLLYEATRDSGRPRLTKEPEPLESRET
jgi:23S rRNA (guanosine2251-2'-O)-methyltransferase